MRVSVYQSLRTGEWMLSAVTDNGTVHVELKHVVGQPVRSAERANIVAIAWVNGRGVLKVACPECGAGIGEQCLRRTSHGPRSSSAAHARRTKLVDVRLAEREEVDA